MIRLVAVAAVAALAGCGSGPKPTTTAPATQPASPPVAPEPEPEPEPDPTFESLQIGTSDNIVPGLKVGAEKAGCGIAASDGQDLTIACPEDTLFVRQRGDRVEFACQTLDVEACRALLMKVVEAARN